MSVVPLFAEWGATVYTFCDDGLGANFGKQSQLEQYQQTEGVAAIGGLDIGEELQERVEKVGMGVNILGEGL